MNVSGDIRGTLEGTKKKWFFRKVRLTRDIGRPDEITFKSEPGNKMKIVFDWYLRPKGTVTYDKLIVDIGFTRRNKNIVPINLMKGDSLNMTYTMTVDEWT